MSEVAFTNLHPSTIHVAYMRRDFACKDECNDVWRALGWINLQPGERQTRDNPTDNRWYYYYAEAEGGGTWSGPFITRVTRAKFSKCTCTSTFGWFDVGMQELDLDEFGGVVFV